MKFKKVGFRNFRNLKDGYVDIPNRQILLVGENGQGKTNFLEALYFICYGSSFRTKNLKECINYGKNNFEVWADIINSSGYDSRINIKYNQGKKSILIDNQEIHDRKELIYNIPCVNFSYDDIEIIRGLPQERRNFFDQILCMYDSIYLDNLRKYKVCLKQRNAAIKDLIYELIPIYNQKLAEYGFNIFKARKKLITYFNSIFPDFYSEIAQDNRKMKISYNPSWKKIENEKDIIEILEKNQDLDFKMLTTTTGIHRDKFIISDQNGPFINSGSTGQLRLASLVLKSIQAFYFKNYSKLEPILLIDDVLLELDSKKRGKFLEKMVNYSQVFFTFLIEEKYFSKIKEDSLIFKVEKGEVFNEG